MPTTANVAPRPDGNAAVMFAIRHPYATVALFLATVTALGILTEIAPPVAYIIAATNAILTGRWYVRHQSAAYVSPDCRDGQHAACAGCWDDCHNEPAPEHASAVLIHAQHQAAVSEANR